MSVFRAAQAGGSKLPPIDKVFVHDGFYAVTAATTAQQTVNDTINIPEGMNTIIIPRGLNNIINGVTINGTSVSYELDGLVDCSGFVGSVTLGLQIKQAISTTFTLDYSFVYTSTELADISVTRITGGSVDNPSIVTVNAAGDYSVSYLRGFTLVSSGISITFTLARHHVVVETSTEKSGVYMDVVGSHSVSVAASVIRYASGAIFNENI